MRHVQPAQGIHQNLVAYQDREEIYFLTVRQIDKDEELFVWYGYDFAKRLQERTSEDNWPVVPSTRIYQAGNYPQQPLSVEVSSNVIPTCICSQYKQFCFLTLKYDSASGFFSFLLLTSGIKKGKSYKPFLACVVVTYSLAKMEGKMFVSYLDSRIELKGWEIPSNKFR